MWLRLLVRHSGAAATAMLAPALGIGANTAVFSAVHPCRSAPRRFRRRTGWF
ncbi:MAG TPA: hypothetical protein VGS58_14530 [Candidatus Sulfopaludibacter sp.]|nr:hypothetical protein [Candidatus Sulfopaludibacter sp.]